MKFYMTPGSCSTGIHILLEEVGKPFEAYIVNLMAGNQYLPEFVAINPKSTIPVLVRDDGSALTEFQAIAYWLGRNFPKARLLPDDEEGICKALEHMAYITATLHGQGFARIFTTNTFTSHPEEHEAVQAQGLGIVERGFAILDAELAKTGYLVGEHFSIADAALFYVEFWADKTGVSMPEHCLAHYQRVLQRPAVRQVLQEEGYQV